MSTRAVDVGLVCAFLAASFSAWSTETAWRQAIAIGLAAAAAGVAYLSSGPGIWLRKVHLAVSDSPGTGIRHVRKVGAKLPTPYPDAWYSVALTETLPPGMALPVTVCNINLVVWRPELKAGESAWPAPVVMDAYCTHLGAHLALGGGRIEGDCIRCPFHGWQFDASGKLRAVPESDTCPTNADMKTWPSMEKNSVVSVWMSSQIHKRAPVTDDEVARLDARVGAFQLNGDATPAPARAPSEALKRVDIEYEPTTVASKCEGRTDAVQSSGDILPQRRQLNRPWFTIPTFDQLNGPNKWKFHGYTENIVNAVLFEIPENGSDVAHLPALHREFVIPSLTWAFSHQWAATWNGTPTGPRSHVADITVGVDTVRTLNGCMNQQHVGRVSAPCCVRIGIPDSLIAPNASLLDMHPITESRL